MASANLYSPPPEERIMENAQRLLKKKTPRVQNLLMASVKQPLKNIFVFTVTFTNCHSRFFAMGMSMGQDRIHMGKQGSWLSLWGKYLRKKVSLFTATGNRNVIMSSSRMWSMPTWLR